MKNDREYQKQVEEVLKEEYGEKCLKDPMEEWNHKKEREFLDDYKKFVELQKREEIKDTPETIIINKMVKKKNKECKMCSKNVFTNRDTIYITKHQVCEKCFVLHLEGR